MNHCSYVNINCPEAVCQGVKQKLTHHSCCFCKFTVGDELAEIIGPEGGGLVQDNAVVFGAVGVENMAEIILDHAEALTSGDKVAGFHLRIPEAMACGHEVDQVGQVDRAVPQLGGALQQAQVFQDIKDIFFIRVHLCLGKTACAAAFQQNAGNAEHAGVIVGSGGGSGFDHIGHLDVKGGLAGGLRHSVVRCAHVIHVGGQVFKNFAAVQVDVEINLGIEAVLKKMGDAVGQGSFPGAGKNAVEIFIVLGHERGVAGLKARDIDGVYENKASTQARGVQLAGQLDGGLDADVFAAVDAAGDEDGFSAARAVDQGDGHLNFGMGDGQHALDLLAR